MGWHKNLDVSDDLTNCWWTDMIIDARIPAKALWYEGGYGFSTGVWRSSESSIMLYTPNNEFNAVSRREIYKRIMGDAYNYEDFIAYYLLHQNSFPSRYKASTTTQYLPPLAPPVMSSNSEE